MPKAIGQFLVERGVLNQIQVEQILEFSKKTGLRFGEAGLELGLLSYQTLEKVFGPNYRVERSYSANKPPQTKNRIVEACRSPLF